MPFLITGFNEVENQPAIDVTDAAAAPDNVVSSQMSLSSGRSNTSSYRRNGMVDSDED